MPTYDPNILQTYADRLYRRAHALAAIYAAATGFIGFIATLFYMASRLGPQRINEGMITATIVGVICAIPGAIYGEARSFHLKLEAQKTLCQLQIEQNTRAAAVRELVDSAHA